MMREVPANRREMAVLLNSRMNRAYSQLADGARLQPDSSLVKTYMVEAHPLGPDAHDGSLQLLRDSFDDTASPLHGLGRTEETEEEGFFRVHVRRRDASATLYVDASHPRFWLVHSPDRSTEVDWVMERLTSTSPRFDTAWLPMQMLEAAAARGAFRGLGLDFDTRPLLQPTVDHEGDGRSVEFLKMQLWGNQAKRVLSVLSAEGAFPNETTLSKVRVKYTLPDSNGDFSLDDMRYDGKVTGRGTSFQSHIAFTSLVYEEYRRWVAYVEETLALRWTIAEGAASMSGCPLGIRFRTPVDNLHGLVDRLFSAAPPFRLWGVPRWLSDSYASVPAVDLHVGHPLDIEVTPELLRVYLPEGSCGNSLLRLFTNLQHCLDAQATAEGPGGVPLFE